MHAEHDTSHAVYTSQDLVQGLPSIAPQSELWSSLDLCTHRNPPQESTKTQKKPVCLEWANASVAVPGQLLGLCLRSIDPSSYLATIPLDVYCMLRSGACAWLSPDMLLQLVVGLSERAGESLPFVLVAAKDDLGMSNVSGPHILQHHHASSVSLQPCCLGCRSRSAYLVTGYGGQQHQCSAQVVFGDERGPCPQCVCLSCVVDFKTPCTPTTSITWTRILFPHISSVALHAFCSRRLVSVLVTLHHSLPTALSDQLVAHAQRLLPPGQQQQQQLSLSAARNFLGDSIIVSRFH